MDVLIWFAYRRGNDRNWILHCYARHWSGEYSPYEIQGFSLLCSAIWVFKVAGTRHCEIGARRMGYEQVPPVARSEELTQVTTKVLTPALGGEQVAAPCVVPECSKGIPHNAGELAADKDSGYVRLSSRYGMGRPSSPATVKPFLFRCVPSSARVFWLWWSLQSERRFAWS